LKILFEPYEIILGIYPKLLKEPIFSGIAIFNELLVFWPLFLLPWADLDPDVAFTETFFLLADGILAAIY
jgi:hypothetical protein